MVELRLFFFPAYILITYNFYIHLDSSYRTFRELELERIAEENRIDNYYLRKKKELEISRMEAEVNIYLHIAITYGSSIVLWYTLQDVKVENIYVCKKSTKYVFRGHHDTTTPSSFQFQKADYQAFFHLSFVSVVTSVS